MALRANGARLGEREPDLMGRGVKNTGATHASRGCPWMATQGLHAAGTAQRKVFPAAAMDGFTAARDVRSGSRLPLRGFRVALEHT